jgi:ketosteroid isomerase-like protein
MESHNIELLRRFLEAVNRRDAEGMVACLDPDAEFIPIMAALEGRVYRGEQGVRQWLAEIEEHWEHFETCPEGFEDLGDRVLGFGHWRASGRASGITIDGQPATWLARVREGTISWERTYTDRAEALAAAGVTEQELVTGSAKGREPADSRNVEMVRRNLEAVNRRDADGMLACMHSENEFIPIMAALEGRVYRGEEGVRQWLAEMEDHWEYFETCPEEFHDLSGDRVIAFGHWRARGRASGVEIDGQPATWSAYIQEGKIIKWRTFTNRAEALEAAFVTEAELASLGTER